MSAAQPQPAPLSASLYVGDLHPDVNETQLFDIFKQLGPVASIRVCRDAVTRRSLGYAYLNFHNMKDAERALDVMNFKDIKGRPCRIMWSQRDPSLRRSAVGNIFIKNLDKEIDHKSLYDTFSTFGNILSCKVAQDGEGRSLGYAFVHYETAEGAEEAIAKVNGKLLNGKKVFVGPFVSRKERLPDADEPKWTNVFVKNLPKTMTEEKFKELFGAYGHITSSMLAKNEDNTTRGFGFVNFEFHEDAAKAAEELNNKEIDGQEIFVGRAQKKAERDKELREMFEKLKRERSNKYQGVNLYVKNLDDAIDDDKLREAFSPCGTITSAKVMRDEKGVSKGFGFVCFATPDEATKAVTELNGKHVLQKPIFVALAQRKDQRRVQLEQAHAQRNALAHMQKAQGIPPEFMYPGAPVFYQPQARGFMSPYPPQMGAPRGGPRMPGQPGPRGPAGGYPGGYMVGPRTGMPGRGGRGGVPRPGNGGGRGGSPQMQGGYSGIKFNANVRNPGQPQGQIGGLSGPADAGAEDTKMVLGETLFPRIQASLRAAGHSEDLAGKVTGMLLDSLDTPELAQLAESAEALTGKVAEALEVLEAHEQQQKAEEAAKAQ